MPKQRQSQENIMHQGQDNIDHVVHWLTMYAEMKHLVLEYDRNNVLSPTTKNSHNTAMVHV